eukprot:TRINITY_DN180_c0_g1_i1.p1 TRINITY_DN180_c0_g1~~TRINITY_DN180_c0_g1_i1.p1  ORF type:complete len:851 (+),score=207.32 TRINITY_DN180_c0_g1_i1:12298-14850(+)
MSADRAAASADGAHAPLPPHPPPLPAAHALQPHAMARSSLSLQLARLIKAYLRPLHPPPSTSMGATLSALLLRLEQQTAFFDSKPDILAWQVREALRTEFFKIVYPTPPTPALCALVQNCEQLLQRYHLPHRPFFFPGGRVAVPTEAGSRRAATSLQLRFKMAAGITVTEAMLHLDGPDGGAFQWVQTHALTPLAPLLAAVQVAAQPPPHHPPASRAKRRRATAQKRPRQSRSRARRASQPVTPALSPPQSATASLSLPQRPPLPHMHRSTSLSAPSPPSTPMRSAPQLLVPTHSQPLGAALAHSAAPTQAALSAPARVSNVVARLAKQDGSGVFVPKELLTFAPPPRARLCEGVVSHASGSLRRALDVGSGGVLASLHRVKNLVLVERLLARKFEAQHVLYYVVWGGRGVKNGSWEKREALMKDVPALVRQFDVRHPQLPEHVKLHGAHDRDGWQASSDAGVNSNGGSWPQFQVGGSDGVIGARGGGTGGTGAGPDGSASGIDGVLGGVTMGEIENRVSTTTSMGRASSTTEVGSVGGAHGGAKQVKLYVDDLTGERIPSWVDTPIVELSICGMILQIRRPDEAVLHNDATAAVRDTKKRQARFKQENILLGERLFPLTKSEAKATVEASVRVHRQYNRLPILFPRGVGRVSAGDHGMAFSDEDARRAPACWEGYLRSLGLRSSSFERELAPHMPAAEEWVRARVARAREELTLATAMEHRERARSVLREWVRHTGAPPPAHVFRDGVRAPPARSVAVGVGEPAAKRRRVAREEGGGGRGSARGRDARVEAALRAARRSGGVGGTGGGGCGGGGGGGGSGDGGDGAWFDEMWSCWRRRRQRVESGDRRR